MNLAATVDGVIQDWTRHFQDNWSDFCHLKVLSFHYNKGDMMTNNTDPTNPALLLPVQDGNANKMRKQGDKFVCMQLCLDCVTGHSFEVCCTFPSCEVEGLVRPRIQCFSCLRKLDIILFQEDAQIICDTRIS